jgi:hypothetical protein
MQQNAGAFIGRWALALWTLVAATAAAAPPEDFPRFIVPGHERLTESIRNLFWLHYEPARPLIPLWDAWLPQATLWPARGEGAELGAMRRRWADALASRRMGADGYVHTEQHDGPAHAEGWPFPFWTHAGGVGWHFAPIGIPGYEAPLAKPDGWQLTSATSGEVGERGWRIKLDAAQARMQTPAFSIAARQSPWLRLNWRPDGLERANCRLEWTTEGEPEFGPERRMYFSAGDATAIAKNGETRTMIPVYQSPNWRGTITGLRIEFDNAAAGQIVIKSFHTACDTRHNINNLNFIRGCHDYFMWTRDIGFLRSQIGRIRAAMRYVEQEFETRERKCVYTTWPGHEGRSGVRWVDGAKTIVPGEGIGSNYWDLLPFGGEDALATVYYYDALQDLAAIEAAIIAHPEWAVFASDSYDPQDLRHHAEEVKAYAGERFWNEETGRFGTRDLDGKLYDYGFTFLNTEAVSLGLATLKQAKSIHAWLSGARNVEGDTSQGNDIYHWRFGPRSTTRRNVDYYVWNWSAPESVPWGYQVQDGGAVLGWSYYDLMARLKTAGPDDAAARLVEIARWFEETQAEGGYRAYYGKDPARGTMQGGNVAGGLGLDKEFFESVLAPQVMLYGFLGFRPTADGFAIDPCLPTGWPELTITRIQLHDDVLDITATAAGEISVKGSRQKGEPLIVEAPAGARVSPEGGVPIKVSQSSVKIQNASPRAKPAAARTTDWSLQRSVDAAPTSATAQR